MPAIRLRDAPVARFARFAADWTGTTSAFVAAVLLILLWACSYPLFRGFGDKQFDTWQLVINTATTIVTFLMVFLIQRAQNKDSRAIHLKLNELVAAMRGASNRLVAVEDLTEDEVAVLHKHYRRLVELAQADESLTQSHSVEEAAERHEEKKRQDG